MTVLGVGLGLILLLLLLLFGRRKGGARETLVTEEPLPRAEAEEVTEVAAEEITESREETGGAETELDTESTTQFLAGEEEAASPSAEAPPEEEAEEDPLAEVNVYLAYERFDQAEELVKKVIAEHPEEDSYRLRLLEVYYSANDKASYEAAARELHDRVDGSGPLWDSAVAMWSEMSPERALFEEAAPGAEVESVTEAAADEGAQGFVDITAEDETAGGVGGDTLSIAPGEDSATSLGDTVSPVEAGEETATDTGLDFELATEAGEEGLLDITQDSAGAEEDMLDLTAASGGADEALLDITQDSAGAEEDMLDLTAASSAADEDLLDLTGDSMGESGDMLDLTATGEDSGQASPAGQADEDMGLDFTGAEDLLDITAAEESEDTDAGVAETGLEFDVGGDETPDTEAGSGDLLDLTSTSEAGADLLDVTASGSLESDESESLLDVTSISSPPGAAAENKADVLDLSMPETAGEGGAADDSLLDLDLGDEDVAATDEAGEDSGVATGGEVDEGLEFDISSLEMESEEDTELAGEGGSEQGFDEDLETTDLSDLVAEMDAGEGLAGEAEPAQGADAETDDLDMDLTLDVGAGQAEDDAVEVDELEVDEIDTSLEALSDSLADDDQFDLEISPEEGMDLEISSEDDSDLLETVQLGSDEGAESELSEQTLVMPRSGDAEEQSDEDEVDTKLNLAKAYIELGDKDGARTILDEVRASGTDQQKKEAEELAGQLG